MFNFESWFLCQFSSNTWMFFVEGLLTPQKLENEKIKSQISILGGIKLQKGEGGVFHRQNRSQNFRFYKCYDICFCSFCEKHPLIRKKRFLSLKKIFSKYLTSFFGCSRRPNIWFMTFLSLFPSSSSDPSSTRAFFIYLEYLDAKKMMDKVEISVWNIWMWRKWEVKFRNP